MAKHFSLLAGAAAAALLATSAQAAIISLDFEDVADYPNNNDVTIDGFYNGGTASNGNSGANYGVEFSDNTLLLCLNKPGVACSNTSRGEAGPSDEGAIYFLNGAAAFMNVAAGFTDGFSFNYSIPFTLSSVFVYDGLNGTGNILASAQLPLTADGACDSVFSNGASYCPFESFGIAFNGTAKSVGFGGTNQAVYDDITFGSVIPGGGGVPEPSTWALLIMGFGAAGATLRSRRRVMA